MASPAGGRGGRKKCREDAGSGSDADEVEGRRLAETLAREARENEAAAPLMLMDGPRDSADKLLKEQKRERARRVVEAARRRAADAAAAKKSAAAADGK